MGIPLGIYKHYKGDRYRVIGVAKLESTLEEMVVYEPMYDNPVSKLFVRPLTEFVEIIERPNYHGLRFTLQEGE